MLIKLFSTLIKLFPAHQFHDIFEPRELTEDIDNFLESFRI